VDLLFWCALVVLGLGVVLDVPAMIVVVIVFGIGYVLATVAKL
jgi:hypothetical protein